MASSRGSFGGFFAGLLAGLIFIGGLLALASALAPDVRPGEMRLAEAPKAPAPAPTAKPEAAPEPAAEPQPPAPPKPEPEPQAQAQLQPAPQPQPQAEPQPQAQAEPQPQPQPQDQARAAQAAPPANAMRRNRERYLGDRAAPMLTIVIDDVGAPGQPIAEVLLMPSPLTVVVRGDAPNAAALALDARDAGFEAMIGVTAEMLQRRGGVEAALKGNPPVIGVAAIGAALTDSPALADLMRLLKARGMGLLDLTAPGGGASFRLAQGAGLPSARLGRRIDQTPSSAAVYQALERAAFDARRAGAFVVAARPDPQVLNGIRRWMNVKAGKTVDLAPLSAVLEKLRRKEG